MNINEVDKFRKDFFDKLINEEKAKEAAIMRQQANCLHKYNQMSDISTNGYQSRMCSKCGHTVTKSIHVWQGTANGTCIIA